MINSVGCTMGLLNTVRNFPGNSQTCTESFNINETFYCKNQIDIQFHNHEVITDMTFIQELYSNFNKPFELCFEYDYSNDKHYHSPVQN